METAYDGRQVVGMDLHRRRSVLVRMTEDGRRLTEEGFCEHSYRCIADIAAFRVLSCARPCGGLSEEVPEN
jgi:DNA-binding MarR family transcriptional regulator